MNQERKRPQSDLLTHKCYALLTSFPSGATNVNKIIRPHALSSAVGTILFAMGWIKRVNGRIQYTGPANPGQAEAEYLVREVRKYARNGNKNSPSMDPKYRKEHRQNVKVIKAKNTRSISLLWGLVTISI